jgi:hypothetical protein
MNRLGSPAIWTRIAPEHLIEYHDWLSREHIGQRIFSEGFLTARVYTSADDRHLHFIFYLVDDVKRFQGETYLDVLNNPTPWTQKMMPKLLDFDRAVSVQTAKIGDGSGAHISVARLGGLPVGAARFPLPIVTQARAIEGLAAVRLLQVDRGGTDLFSEEKTMRTGAEGQFSYLLIAEGMTAEAARQGCDLAVSGLGATVLSQQVYSLIYVLEPFEKAVLTPDPPG